MTSRVPSAFLLAILSSLLVLACSAPSSESPRLTGSAETLGSTALTPVPADELAAAHEEFLAGCHPVGSFCSMRRIEAFTVDGGSFEEVLKAVDEHYADEQWTNEYWDAEMLTRDELAASVYFHYYGGGHLLDAVDAWAGSTNVVARSFLSELPCPNCH